MTALKVTPRVRQIVLERDLFSCARCGLYIGPFTPYSLHHRRPRGAGGSRRPETNLPANLLVLCGHATSPDGCHQYVERHREEAREAGYILTQQQTPAEVPVFTHRGWLLLDDEGAFTYCSRPEGSGNPGVTGAQPDEPASQAGRPAQGDA